MTSTSPVPVVDLAPWASGADRTAVAAAVDVACREVGFFQIVGHGIPTEVITAMRDATNAFFDLPVVSKLRFTSPSPDINRGYAAKGSEALSYSLGEQVGARPPDLFEALNVGPEDLDPDDPVIAAQLGGVFAPNIWPDAPADLRTAVMAYFAEARRVAHVLTDVFALALGLSDGWFAPYTDHSTDTLRIIDYRTAPGDPDPLDGQLGMGAHTDYGICTVLYADPVPGLQIVGPDGDWLDVVPAEGALLVNLGDLTAQWTNDRWRSTIHRVLPPARRPDAVNRRRSVAFFHDGNWDALVECLPTCRSEDDPPRYPPVRALDHLMAKLLGPRTLTASDAADTAGERLRVV